MKKSFAILLLVLMVTLSACGSATTPDPRVEAFLNTELSAQKAFDAIETATYTTTIRYETKDGTVKGTSEYYVNLNKQDPDALYLQMVQRFTGTNIVDGLEDQTITLEKNKTTGVYTYTTVVNGEEKVEQVEDSFALDLLTSIVYQNNGVYDEGGLYYGDFFMLYIYKYPTESFSISEDGSECVFDEKLRMSRDDVGEVYLYQTTKVNSLGLMTYDYERYEGVEADYVVISQTIPEYTLD